MVLFREEQRFTWLRIPVIVFVIILSFISVSGLFQQLAEGRPWGNNPMSDRTLIFVNGGALLIIWGVFFIIFSARLETVITKKGLEFRFPPFFHRFRKIEPGRIVSYEIKKYNPILDYGGYGIRFGSGKKGRAYNTSGNQGLFLVLENGKSILLGTQRPTEISFAMKKMLKPEND